MIDNEDNQRGLDASFEDEVSSRRTVTIPLREYDKLKEKTKFITDPTLIGYIDKIEFFVKEIRKHIVRTDIEKRNIGQLLLLKNIPLKDPIGGHSGLKV